MATQVSRVSVGVAGVRTTAGLTLKVVVVTRASRTGAALGVALASRLFVVLGTLVSPGSEAAHVSCVGVGLVGVWGAAGLTLDAVTVTRASRTGAVLRVVLASLLLVVLGALVLPEAVVVRAAAAAFVSRAGVDVAGKRSVATSALEAAGCRFPVRALSWGRRCWHVQRWRRQRQQRQCR